MENFNTRNSLENGNELPSWIKKLKNYGLAASVALSTFLASCGTTPEGAPKQKISAEALEKLPNLGQYEKITPEMIQNIREALGDTGDSLYLNIDNQDLNDQIEISNQSASMEKDHHLESVYGFSINDSMYSFTVQRIDEFNRLHNDTLEYRKFDAGPIISDLQMRTTKKTDDYFVEVNKKTGVIVSYTHTSTDDKGEQIRMTNDGSSYGSTEKSVINKNSDFFVVASDGNIEKSTNTEVQNNPDYSIEKESAYSTGEAVELIKEFDKEVGNRDNKNLPAGKYINYYVLDKNNSKL